jgi:hypothetical protein
MSSYEGGQAPDRLREILEALAKYHTHILQTATLKTQSPAFLNDIEEELETIGNDLLQRWNTNSFDTNTEIDSPELQLFITTVKTNLTPWNAQVSTLVPYWIERMFFHAPFAISTQHIERLHRNSQYNQKKEDADTEPSS